MGTPLPSPKRGGAPKVYCGQTAGWIKMVLGMEVGLSPGNFVFDWDPAPLTKKGAEPPIFGPCLLRPNGCMDQDGTWHGGAPWSKPHCARWGPSSPPQKGYEAPSQFLVHFYCGQTAGCIKMPLGTEVGLSPGDMYSEGFKVYEIRSKLKL